MRGERNQDFEGERHEEMDDGRLEQWGKGFILAGSFDE